MLYDAKKPLVYPPKDNEFDDKTVPQTAKMVGPHGHGATSHGIAPSPMELLWDPVTQIVVIRERVRYAAAKCFLFGLEPVAPGWLPRFACVLVADTA